MAEHPSTASANWPFNSAELALIRNSATHVFASVAAVGYNGRHSRVVDESSATYINTARVGGDFFDVLGVQSFLGRTLNRNDDTGRLGARARHHARPMAAAIRRRR